MILADRSLTPHLSHGVSNSRCNNVWLLLGIPCPTLLPNSHLGSGRTSQPIRSPEAFLQQAPFRRTQTALCLTQPAEKSVHARLCRPLLTK